MKKINEIYQGVSVAKYYRQVFLDYSDIIMSENWKKGNMSLKEAVYIDKDLADFAFFLNQNKNRADLDIIKTIKRNKHFKGDSGLILYLDEKGKLAVTEEIKRISSEKEKQGLSTK